MPLVCCFLTSNSHSRLGRGFTAQMPSCSAITEQRCPTRDSRPSLNFVRFLGQFTAVGVASDGLWWNCGEHPGEHHGDQRNDVKVERGTRRRQREPQWQLLWGLSTNVQIVSCHSASDSDVCMNFSYVYTVYTVHIRYRKSSQNGCMACNRLSLFW